jgi:D-alanine-D-alanine ligase
MSSQNLPVVALIFGGQSPEHSISILSAKNIFAAFDRTKYDPLLIGISKGGEWYHIPHFPKEENPNWEIGKDDSHERLALIPGSNNPIVLVSGLAFPKIDVVFNIVHGVSGEDGSLQGLLKLIGLPFVGPNVLGSAIGFDKDVTKRLARDGGILVAPWVTVYRHNWESLDLIEETSSLKWPLFVKPANSGSSVGVTKASDFEGLRSALKTAFLYDFKVLIEEGIVGRELETAVMGNEFPMASGVGEVVVGEGIYDFDNKYSESSTATVIIPAKGISIENQEKIKKTSLRTYEVLCLEGLARVDVFLTESGEVYLNEPNTLPGFTNISMYPKLWGETGLGYSELISQLLEYAIKRAPQVL